MSRPNLKSLIVAVVALLATAYVEARADEAESRNTCRAIGQRALVGMGIAANSLSSSGQPGSAAYGQAEAQRAIAASALAEARLSLFRTLGCNPADFDPEDLKTFFSNKK